MRPAELVKRRKRQQQRHEIGGDIRKCLADSARVREGFLSLKKGESGEKGRSFWEKGREAEARKTRFAPSVHRSPSARRGNCGKVSVRAEKESEVPRVLKLPRQERKLKKGRSLITH